MLVEPGFRPTWPALVEHDPNYKTHFMVKRRPFNDQESDDEEASNSSQQTETEEELDDSEMILDPVAYHVSLLGDPVVRVWVDKKYMKPYNKKNVSIRCC